MAPCKDPFRLVAYRVKSKTSPVKKKQPVRRRASQARSKLTVQRILNAASALMIEKGAEVTMTEIAQRAGVVIGTLYQYFSDKSAIHRAILLQHMAEVRQMLRDFAGQAQTLEQFVKVMELAYEHYFAQHQKDPLYNALWAIVQTDAELQLLDTEDSLENGRYLAGVCSRFLPNIDPDRLVASCALLTQLALTAARFARGIPPNLAQHTRPFFRSLIRVAYAEFKAEDRAAARKN